MKHRDLHRQTLILQVSLDAFFWFKLDDPCWLNTRLYHHNVNSQKSMISPPSVRPALWASFLLWPRRSGVRLLNEVILDAPKWFQILSNVKISLVYCENLGYLGSTNPLKRDQTTNICQRTGMATRQ